MDEFVRSDRKFDLWSDRDENGRLVSGIFNNEMVARQHIDEWAGTVAPSKEAAVNKLAELNGANDVEAEY